jgi:hypothetical protein
MSVKAGIHLADCNEGSDQQRRPDQQHQGQGHLGGYELGAQSIVALARATASAAFFQRSAQIRTGRLRAGTSPNKTPVRIDNETVNAKTRQSRFTFEPRCPIRGRLSGMRVKMAGMPR